MAMDILANRSSKSNLHSSKHHQLYTKILFQGRMTALLNYHDTEIGLTEAAGVSVNEWHKRVGELADLLI